MEQELELSEYATYEAVELKGIQTTSVNPRQSERRLLRIGVFTLGLLCILQATLNISLRLGFYSKEEFPFNGSALVDLCPSQQNTTQFCSCCINLLRRFQREYQALETERDLLQHTVNQLRRDMTTKDDHFQDFESGSGSGSGSLENFLNF